MGGNIEDGTRPVSEGTGIGKRQQRRVSVTKRMSPYKQSEMEQKLRLWNLHPWRHQNLNWMWPWARFKQDFGLDDLQKCLLADTCFMNLVLQVHMPDSCQFLHTTVCDSLYELLLLLGNLYLNICRPKLCYEFNVWSWDVWWNNSCYGNLCQKSNKWATQFAAKSLLTVKLFFSRIPNSVCE